MMAATVAGLPGGMEPVGPIAVWPERVRGAQVHVTPPVADEKAADLLVDGDARTSHSANTQIKWPAGAAPSVTIDLRAPLLVTRVEVGYAGGMGLAGAARREGETWAPLPVDLFEDTASAYPKTSWLIARELAVRAEALRLRWTVGAGGGQITEIRVFGEPAAVAGRLGCLAVAPRLPAANTTADVLVDLRNPLGKDTEAMEVRFTLRDRHGKEVAVAGPVARAVPPMRAAAVRLPMRLPGPGRYDLTASVGGAERGKISRTIYVLNRELQFIWFGVPEEARWATMLTTVSEPIEIERWQRRGVVPLGWAGGYGYRDKYDEDGFADYWTGKLKGHPVGIAVDEFGNHAGKPTDLQMANGLLRAHLAAPGKTIVIWQAGISPPEVAGPYRIAADWIVPECYMNYFNNRFAQFDLRIKKLRELGLIHKSVMGLCCTSDKIGTTAAGLEEQVRYVRRQAPEMPGLGFYKAYGTGEALVPVADRLCYEYFIKPTILAEASEGPAGRVLLHNIGALAARDVDAVFESGEGASAKVVQAVRIELIMPDAVAEVRLDTSRSGSGACTFRVAPSQAYSCVSPPLALRVSGDH